MCQVYNYHILCCGLSLSPQFGNRCPDTFPWMALQTGKMRLECLFQTSNAGFGHTLPRAIGSNTLKTPASPRSHTLRSAIPPKFPFIPSGHLSRPPGKPRRPCQAALVELRSYPPVGGPEGRYGPRAGAFAEQRSHPLVVSPSGRDDVPSG